MTAKLRLGRHQANNEVWTMISAHYQQRLQLLRAKLENPLTPEADRTGLIYRIDEIKRLLAAAEQDDKDVADAGL
jgi:hypothetical protein